MISDWVFPEITGAQLEGFNSSGIAIFSGNQTSSLVRELIQNSLDARVNQEEPVEIKLEMVSIPQDELPEITSLASHLAEAAKQEEKLNVSSGEGQKFYGGALEILKAGTKINLFVAHDANTHGLTGPLKFDMNQPEYGSWLSLIRSSGVTVKSTTDALGSFGQGSKAPFAFSRLRTVFYLSRVPATGNSTQVRGIGKSILQSMSIADNRYTSSVGYLGVGDEADAMVDDQVPTWMQACRAPFGEQTGTSVFVVEPRLEGEVSDFWFEVKISCISNFYFAIRKRNLRISLGDGSQLDANTIAAELDAVTQKLAESVPARDLPEGLQVAKTISVAELDSDSHGELKSKSFGNCVWFIRKAPSVSTRRVGIARRSGMLITRRPPSLERFSGLQPFDLFVCVTDSKGSEILRRFEDPQHTSFQFDRIEDVNERKILKSLYEGFAVEVRELLKTLVPIQVLDEIKTNDLNEIFGRNPGSEPQGGLLTESSTKLVIGSPPAPTRPESGLILADGDSIDTTGRGYQGGTKTKKTVGGNLPGSGSGRGKGKGSPGIAVKNFRWVILDSETGQIRIFFTPVSSQPGDISLYRTGEDSREQIAFKTSLEGQSQQALALSDLEGGRRKSLDVFIDRDLLGFTFEALIKND